MSWILVTVGIKLSKVNVENKQSYKSFSSRYYWEIFQQCHRNTKYEEYGSSSDEILCIIGVEMKAFL